EHRRRLLCAPPRRAGALGDGGRGVVAGGESQLCSVGNERVGNKNVRAVRRCCRATVDRCCRNATVEVVRNGGGGGGRSGGRALTRPDGVLIGATLFAARAVYELSAHHFNWRAAVKGGLLFVLVVGGHFTFRRLYYADWLPNTYYAKLGGESWWGMGFLYLATF